MERYSVFMDWKNTVKMFILSKAIYRFNAIAINIPMASFFHRNRKNNPKICMETQRFQIAKEIVKKKEKVGSIILPDLKVYYKSTLIKTVCHWHKSRHIIRQNLRAQK